MSKNAAVLLFFLILLTAACLVFVKPVASFDDVTEKSWTTKTPMHEARAFLGVAAVNGKIYAIGGAMAMRVITSSVEEYDPGIFSHIEVIETKDKLKEVWGNIRSR